MDFSLSEEQRAFRESAAQHARAHLSAPLAEFSRERWQRCADFGVQGWPLPEEYGGSAADVVTTMLGMEALGYGGADQGLLFSLHAHMWAIEMPILAFGSDEQKRRLLPPLCDGRLVGAHAMSEPGSGTDAFALRARAELRGDRYVLRGAKTFVTNAPVADLVLVFATVNPKRGMWGITAFLIERDRPGLSVGRPFDKMGLSSSPMAEVALEDCEVPVENRLGREGQGAAIFNHSMGWERACILASSVGAMERQLETCIEYAKTREQFGRPIGSFQLVASKIADMKLRLETSRLLLYRSAWSQAQGGMTPLEAAMVKLHISEAAVQSALDAIQVHGGYGYMREYGMERALRDAVGGRLYSGTSEIQRVIIARNLGLAVKD
jgi:alkylation response protein AidB-like acyl-CoA dehydrogenase